MLTKLVIRNFKVFDDVEIELGDRVVLVGPNNSGKSSALQALALWNIGVRRWVEKRGAGNAPRERAGVTINRRDLVQLPVPAANLLWRDLHVRRGAKRDGKSITQNILIELEAQGVDEGRVWTARLEFDYANEESFYCRAPLASDGNRVEIPAAAAALKLAFLPPMSGLAANETRLDEGAIAVRIGEGRTAEVLRNLCWQVFEARRDEWTRVVDQMRRLFGVTLEEPRYVRERGEIDMTYKTNGGVRLDLSASGRGQQQTLLLLAHMAANPCSVLLLDEPDAHLEVLRQRQIYEVLGEAAAASRSQIVAASHSEVLLSEAAGRDIVVAFLGKPHRIDDRGHQVAKALREIGYDQYLQAEETGWVLYLEGATDLAILRAFAERMGHRARAALDRPFVHYVANQPGRARDHFYGLKEACPVLIAFALFDRLEAGLQFDPKISQQMWRRREIENYLCQRATLLAFAGAEGRDLHGELFADMWRQRMKEAIDETTTALARLRRPDPWGSDIKASDEFLDPLFANFYEKLGLPNLVRKSDYHRLALHVPVAEIDAEVAVILDGIAEVAERAVSAS
jgi:ABC-type taurine transport system ATPase subunit